MRLNDIKNILEVKREGLKTGGNLILQFLCPGDEAKTQDTKYFTYLT